METSQEDSYAIPFEIMQLEKDIKEDLERIEQRRNRLKYLKALKNG